MQPNVLKECERVSQYSWIFTKLDFRMEVSKHEKASHFNRPYFKSPVFIMQS
jgi:hypothetical protein